MYRKYRKGVFCVVYSSKTGKKPDYLLLHRKRHWKGWEFPKGGRTAREKLENIARREVKEETGLNAFNIKKYKVKSTFLYNKKTQEEWKVKGFIYTLFSCQVKKSRVRISKKEHDSYKWCPYGEAIRLLTWPNQKRCLIIVNNLLKH